MSLMIELTSCYNQLLWVPSAELHLNMSRFSHLYHIIFEKPPKETKHPVLKETKPDQCLSTSEKQEPCC